MRSVVNMPVLRLKAARTRIWIDVAVGLVISCWAVLTLLTFGTWMLTSIILGCRLRVSWMVSSLLVVEFIILNLGLRCNSMVSLSWTSVLLLVSSIWTIGCFYSLVVL